MMESVVQRAQFASELAVRRRKRRWALGLVASSVIVILITLLVTGRLVHGIPWGAGLSIVAIFLVERAYSLVNARCPSCDAYLDAQLSTANFCPSCGIPLEDDDRMPTGVETRP